MRFEGERAGGGGAERDTHNFCEEPAPARCLNASPRPATLAFFVISILFEGVENAEVRRSSLTR